MADQPRCRRISAVTVLVHRLGGSGSTPEDPLRPSVLVSESNNLPRAAPLTPRQRLMRCTKQNLNSAATLLGIAVAQIPSRDYGSKVEMTH